MRWFVDGMNVIGTRPDGWWRDRDAAMARLVRELEDYVAASGDDVTVVFERAPRPPLKSTLVDIAHAPRPGPDAADHEISRRIAADPAPGTIFVATSDRWLADRATALGATVIGAKAFRARLEGG